MRVGDLVTWRSDLMYGVPDTNPMVIIKEADLNFAFLIASLSSGWQDWVCIDELELVSSGDKNE